MIKQQGNRPELQHGETDINIIIQGGQLLLVRLNYFGEHSMVTRPTDHKLGDRNQHLFNMLLDGHTHWHIVVNAARKGWKAQLLQNLYSQKRIIDNAISQLEGLK